MMASHRSERRLLEHNELSPPLKAVDKSKHSTLDEHMDLKEIWGHAPIVDLDEYVLKPKHHSFGLRIANIDCQTQDKAKSLSPLINGQITDIRHNFYEDDKWSLPAMQRDSNKISRSTSEPQSRNTSNHSLPLQYNSSAFELNLDKKLDLILQHIDDSLFMTKAIYSRTNKNKPRPSLKHADTFQKRATQIQNVLTCAPSVADLTEKLEEFLEKKHTCGTDMHTATSALSLGKGRLSLNSDSNCSAGASSVARSHVATGSSAEAANTPDQVHASEIVGRIGKSTTMLDLTKYIMKQSDPRSQKMAMVWRFFEDKNSSHAALVFFYIREVFLFLSILLACIDLVNVSDDFFFVTHRDKIQLGVEILFVVELFLRFLASPQKKLFWRNFYNIIDLFSAFPIVLRIWSMSNEKSSVQTELTSLLGVVPVLRLLRFMRHFETFQLLLVAFEVALKSLPVLIFTLMIISISFAAAIFYCEPRNVIPTMPYSLYFVMVTLSTVGYGDIVPSTVGGRIFTILTIVTGSIYMAIPFGIVGKTFGDVWEDRRRLILLRRMRLCIENAGYTRKEMVALFTFFDENEDGVLDPDEFACLLETMHVYADAKLIRLVFSSFDDNEGDFVEFQVLMQALFPL